MEGQEVFLALTKRFPTLRLDTKQVEYDQDERIRELTSLRVAWNAG